MLNKPEIFELKATNISIKLITDNEGYQRYCINQADAARLLHLTPPAINDKISRGTLESLTKGDKKWIPMDIVLDNLDEQALTMELKVLIDAGVFNYNPVQACLERLLKSRKISWSDLNLETQKIFLGKK